MDRAFGTQTVAARTAARIVIAPVDSPYFEPRRVRMLTVDPNDPSIEMDLKIGAVTVGGSPQLSQNVLDPGASSPGLHPSDLDRVKWSVCSTAGLARELQFEVFNPGDRAVAVFICIEGWALASIENMPPSAPKAEEDGWIDHLASDGATLAPYEQRVLRVEPGVAPYFKPHELRFHGFRMDEGAAKVPFAIIDAFCGRQIMFGTSLDELFNQRAQHEVPSRTRSSPTELLRELERQVSILTTYGREGLRQEIDKRKVVVREDVRGMLTTLLEDPETGWMQVDWPVFSINSLGRTMGIVAYNPWPFGIRVSMSVRGTPMSELMPVKSSAEAEDEGPATVINV